MSQLKDIKKYICQEYYNLENNFSRPRTRAAVANKKNLLNEALKEFSDIIQKYENSKLPSEHWNRLTDQYTVLQSKVCLAIKILNNSAIVPEPNRDRRLSESCLEFEISDFTEEDLKDLERSVIFKELPFSSTIIGLEEEEDNKDNHNHSVFLEQLEKLEEQFVNDSLLINKEDIQKADSFEEHIQNLKNLFYKSSFFIQRNLDRLKMVFPADKAMQFIPEFRGVAVELDAFLNAIEYYAKKIPKDGAHDELIQIVLLKLKGPAAIHFKRIKGETWPEIRACLEKEFGTNVKLEELMQQIETLEQGQNETFQSYKDRALTLKEHIDEYEPKKTENSAANDEEEEEEVKESFAERSLRLHFLGGLKNRNLKNLAKTQKNRSFVELVEYLGDECIDVDQIEQIEKRLRDVHFAESQRNGQRGPKPFNQAQDTANYTRQEYFRRDYNRAPPPQDRAYDRSRNYNGQDYFRRDYNRAPPSYERTYDRPRNYDGQAVS